MTITFNAHYEELVERKLKDGRYADTEALFAHALDLLAIEDEPWSEGNKAELDRCYDEGIAQQQRGEAIPAHKVREALAQLHSAQRGTSTNSPISLSAT